MHNPLKFTDPSGYYPKEMGDHPTPAFSGYNLDQLILSEGGFGGGGSGSYYYTKMFGRGDITYNWYSGNYQYDNGEIASYEQAMNQLYSNTRSNDISTISGSSLFGYDHLYSLSINGQLRLAGSIGGEITGLVRGHFVVTNNAFSAVLAANGEVTALGKGASNGDGVMQARLFGDIFNNSVAYMNVAGSLAGIAEMSTLAARRFDNGRGPKYFAYAMTLLKGSYVGTQEVAKNIRTFGAGAKNLGTKLGIAGGILSTVDYTLNFQGKNGYEHSNYWIGTAVTIGAFVNPIGSGVALIYGVSQGVSWLYNGKTLEENVGESMGW